MIRALPGLTPLLAAVANLVLAAVVARRAQRDSLRTAFVVLAILLVFWNLNFFILQSVENYNLAFSLSRICRTAVMFLPPAILHLMLAVRGPLRPGWRRALQIDYAFSSFLAILNAGDLLVSGLRQEPMGWVSEPTRLLGLFTLSTLINFAVAVAAAAAGYRDTSDLRTRVRIRFWIGGAIVAVPLALTNLLRNYGVPVYPLGPLGTAALAAVIAYAIIRHRLIDIDIVVTKGVAYAGVAVVLIAPAFVLALWLQRASFGQVHTDFSFAILLMLITVGVLFPALRMRAETRLEQSLFRTKYEDRNVLMAGTETLLLFW